MSTKSERTRRRILDAAAEALATRGYDGTSLKSIADAIDMKDASLYYYFDSKDDLVLEVLRIGTALAHDAVVDALAELGDDADPVDALTTAIVAHSEAVLGHDDYPRANVRSYGRLPPHLAEVHRDGQRAYGAVWQDLLERAAGQGAIRGDLDLAATRLLILGALSWAIEWYDPDEALTPTELGRQLAAMVLVGLLNPPGRG